MLERATNGLGLRIASAAVLIPVALYCAWQGAEFFSLLILVAALVMIGEWHRLIGNPLWNSPHIIISIAVAAVIALGSNEREGFAVGALIITAMLAAGLAIKNGYARAAWAFAGVVYVCVPSLALIWLRVQPEIGLAVTIWLFGLVWAADTGAYFAGRLIGGPKLAPKISPKKTWSGMIGGLSLAAAFGALMQGWLIVLNISIFGTMFITVALALLAEMGDLAESALKRYFNVKDTGQLIPGHGGVLDRLDSMLFAAPAMALVLWLIQGGQFWR